MPLIQQPIACRYDRRSQVTRLYFDTTDGKAVQEFYVKGAVSWPDGLMPGFALIAGQNLTDHRVLVFREFSFRTIDHWIRGGQFIQFGFVKFLADAWTQFQCRSFFFSQNEEIHRRFSLDCYRLDLIEPKPEFIRVLYANQDVGDNVIEEFGSMDRLPLDDSRDVDGRPRSVLYEQIREYRGKKNSDPNKPFLNEGTHALRCLLAGFIYNPLPPPPRDEGLIPLEWERRRF